MDLTFNQKIEKALKSIEFPGEDENDIRNKRGQEGICDIELTQDRERNRARNRFSGYLDVRHHYGTDCT